MFVARKTWVGMFSLIFVLTLFVNNSKVVMAGDTISMWVRSDNEIFMTPLVEAYNAKGGDKVKLEIIPAQELMQKLATSYLAGQAPDVVSLDLIYTPQLIVGDILEDITDYAKGLPYFSFLSKAHVGIGSKDGRIFGLPFSAESSFLLYNKKLYREAGLDPEQPPKNWKEFTEHCLKISELGDDVYGFYTCGSNAGWQAFTFNPLVWASGGDTLSADGSKAMVGASIVNEAIEVYRNLYEKGAIPESAATDTGNNMLTGFVNEKVGIMSGGTFVIGMLLNEHPSIEFGVTPIPGKDGGFATFAGGDNIVFPKGTTKLDAAKRFLEWCYSLEGQTVMAKFGSLPVRGDVADKALSSLDERYQMPAKILAQGHTPYSTLYSQIFLNNNGPWAEMLNRGFFTDENISEITGRAQEEIQDIINESRDFF